MIHYPFPWKILVRVLLDRPRSFHVDAEGMVRGVRPPVRYSGFPAPGDLQPCVITVNHYHSPGFMSWWLAFGLSAAIQREIHWVITAAWTYPDRLSAAVITPLSRWFLRRIAQVYGFSTLPPAPPREIDIPEQARAIRGILRYVRTSDFPLVGLAPEGGDFAGPAELAMPPPGAGRLALRLAQAGLKLLPAGVFEAGDQLVIRAGPLYELAPPPGLPDHDRDTWARREIMHKISGLTGFKLKPHESSRIPGYDPEDREE